MEDGVSLVLVGESKLLTINVSSVGKVVHFMTARPSLVSTVSPFYSTKA
jgi:hypothetical protein